MDKGLRAFLDRCTPAEVDPADMESLRVEMEAAVPEIQAVMRDNQRSCR